MRCTIALLAVFTLVLTSVTPARAAELSIELAPSALKVRPSDLIVYAATARSDSTLPVDVDISVILDPALTITDFDGTCVLGSRLLSCQATAQSNAPAVVTVTARAPQTPHCVPFTSYAAVSAIAGAGGIVESVVGSDDVRCTPRAFLPLIVAGEGEG